MTEIRRLLFQMFRKAYRFLRRKITGDFLLVSSIYLLLYRYLKPSGIVSITVQGRKMYLDAQDTGVALPLLMSGAYEEYETKLFRSLIKKGMVVVDVGAHVGYYTLIAADLVGEKGKVFAFEPEPDNYALLVKNIEANGYTNVVPVQKAVSNKTGTVRLFLSLQNKVAHRIYDSNDGREFIRVSVTDLDTFFEDKGYQVDVIKMDVEGSEMGILRGMANTIKKNDDLKIITEFWPVGMRRFGSSPTGFLNKLVEYGFGLYYINGKKSLLEPIDVTDAAGLCEGETPVNLLCKKEKHFRRTHLQTSYVRS